jgi:hypothetical protein
MLNTVRFKITRAVAESLHLSTIKRRARQASVTDVRLDADSRGCARDEIRITCSTAMAIYLVEEFRRVDAHAKARRLPLLSTDCTRAIAATIKAIDEGDRGPAIAFHPPIFGSGSESRV